MPSPVESKEQSEKFKIVIFNGEGVSKFRIKATQQSAIYKVGQVKLINGKIRNIDFSSLKGKTDENTIFIISSHGDINNGRHLIDGDRINESRVDNPIATDQFLNNLKDALTHNINAILFSCYAGATLKTGKIKEGISLVARGSSKYETVTYQSTKAILKILQWKDNESDISIQKILERLRTKDSETFYYRGGNAGDQVIKLPRVGKFSLEEIKLLLAQSEFTEDQKNKIIESFSEDSKEQNKISFSIIAVKKKLNNTALALDKESYDSFISALEFELRKKLSPSETKSLDMASALFMACNRGDVDLVRAITSNNPHLVNINRNGTPLMCAIVEGNAEIVDWLIKKGASIDVISKSGERVLDMSKLLAKNKKDKIEDRKKIYQLISDLAKESPIYREILTKSKTSNNLDISNRKIGTKVVKTIAEILEDNTSVTYLDLSHNNLGPKDVKVIAEILEKNQTITSINLGYNNIGPEGAEAIAAIIEKTTTLTSINPDPSLAQNP